MGQVNKLIRRIQGGFGHWCPGCEEMHVITDAWNFDGNLDNPTFTPSVRVSWFQGPDRDKEFVCHYFLIGGKLQFCGDSTHSLAGQVVPLPDLPKYLCDPIEVEVVEDVVAEDLQHGPVCFNAGTIEVAEARDR